MGGHASEPSRTCRRPTDAAGDASDPMPATRRSPIATVIVSVGGSSRPRPYPTIEASRSARSVAGSTPSRVGRSSRREPRSCVLPISPSIRSELASRRRVSVSSPTSRFVGSSCGIRCSPTLSVLTPCLSDQVADSSGIAASPPSVRVPPSFARVRVGCRWTLAPCMAAATARLPTDAWSARNPSTVERGRSDDASAWRSSRTAAPSGSRRFRSTRVPPLDAASTHDRLPDVPAQVQTALGISIETGRCRTFRNERHGRHTDVIAVFVTAISTWVAILFFNVVPVGGLLVEGTPLSRTAGALDRLNRLGRARSPLASGRVRQRRSAVVFRTS